MKPHIVVDFKKNNRPTIRDIIKPAARSQVNGFTANPIDGLKNYLIETFPVETILTRGETVLQNMAIDDEQ